MCGWVMEIQERGAPHFHLVHAAESEFGKACENARSETLMRGKPPKPTEIVRGGPDFWMVSEWLDIIGAAGCEKSRAFNRGGIIEKFRCPNGAGRYFAKEACKDYQKQLPDIYSEGLGRWWFLHPRWAPKGTALVDLDLSKWPWDWPVKHVWDARDLAQCVTRMTVLDSDSEAARLCAETYSPTLATQLEQLDSHSPKRPALTSGLRDSITCACGRLADFLDDGYRCACGQITLLA